MKARRHNLYQQRTREEDTFFARRNGLKQILFEADVIGLHHRPGEFLNAYRILHLLLSRE